MLEFVLFIILVAWFFGISYGAALHGVLQFILVTIIIGGIIAAILNHGKQTKNQPKEAQIVNKPIKTNKKPSKSGTIFVWICIFIASYCITTLILIILGDIIHFTLASLPVWLAVAIPTLPFDVYLIYCLIKKHASNKNRRAS